MEGLSHGPDTACNGYGEAEHVVFAAFALDALQHEWVDAQLEAPRGKVNGAGAPIETSGLYGPTMRKSSVWAWPLATLKLALSLLNVVSESRWYCQPVRIPVVRLRSMLATLRPRSAPPVNSNFAVPLRLETKVRSLGCDQT